MADSYSVKAILSAVDKNFTSTFKKAESETDSLSQKIKSGLGFGVLSGIGQQAFSQLTQGITGMVGELNNSAKAWKTFEGNMKILNKSSSEISSAKKEMQDYATKTIYNASEMASTFAQLESVGTKNTRKLVKGFGGLAAAAENPKQAMKTLSVQATQMAARPTVAWQDFKLMLEQSPAGMAAVAKEMGKTSDQLVADIQDQTVKTEDFFAAIEKVGNSEGFQKLATEYKTMDQAMDGLQETLSVKLGPAFDKVSGIGISALSKLISKIESVDVTPILASIDAGINWASKAFDKLSKKVMSAWHTFENTGAVEAAKKALLSFKDAVGNVISSVMKSGVIEDLAGFFGELAKQISLVVKGVSDFVAKLDPGLIGTFTKGIVALVGAYKGLKIISSVNSKLKVFNSTVRGFFSKKPEFGLGDAVAKESNKIQKHTSVVGDVLKDLGNGFKSAFEGLGNVITSFGSAVSTLAQGIGTGLATAFRGLGSALAMVPPTTWLSIAAAVLAVGGAFALVGSQGEGLNAILVGVSGVIQQLPPVIVAVGQAIQEACQGIGDIVRSLGDAIGTVVTSISDGMATVSMAIGNAISGVLNALAGIIDAIGNAALNAGNGFNQLANGIAKITKLNLFDMGASLGTVATGLVGIGLASGGISKASNNLNGLVSSLKMVQTLPSTIGNSFNSMATKITASISKINSGVKSGMSKVNSTVKSSLNSMYSTLNAAQSRTYQCGVFIGQGLAQGLRASEGQVRAAAASLANATDAAIRAKARIHSPSKVTTKDGRYIGMGLVNGLKDMYRKVQSVAYNLYQCTDYGSMSSFSIPGGSLNSEFDYSSNSEYTVIVPVQLEGKTIAKVTAPYNEKEAKKQQKISNRVKGVTA